MFNMQLSRLAQKCTLGLTDERFKKMCFEFILEVRADRIIFVIASYSTRDVPDGIFYRIPDFTG
jgi:hypothetical protein